MIPELSIRPSLQYTYPFEIPVLEGIPQEASLQFSITYHPTSYTGNPAVLHTFLQVLALKRATVRNNENVLR